MFVGQGLKRRGSSGLGLYEPTPTGIRFVSAPSCASPQEIEEARSKCSTSTLHGMGQLQTTTRAMAPMSGRLAAYSPCQIKDLPICPPPKCINEETAQAIMQCMSGGTVEGLNCKDPGTAFYLMALAQLPYCSRPSYLTTPRCVSQALRSNLSYCGVYPTFTGPDKTLNAFCWGAKHDASYWKTLTGLPICAPPTIVEKPPVRLPPPPPPVVVAPPPVRRPPVVQERPPTPPPVRPPPSIPPEVRPPPMTPPEPQHEFVPPEEEPPLEPERRESSMMGLWGILALVAVGGGGYYLYRRYKR